MGTLFVDNIKHQSSQGSGTITIGASGETIKAASGATNNIGIGMVDQFRLVSTKTDNSDITANLERVDTSGFGRIGTGMTESSGIFSFPSTGIYLVNTQTYWKGNSGGATYAGVYTSFTQNNSSYVIQGNTYCSFEANNYYQNTFVSVLVDVTDTSLCKVKFTRDASTSNAELRGSTTQTLTGFTFLRLGDT